MATLQADQVHALALREMGGGFAKHHRPPSLRTANYVISKPSVLVDRINIIKKLRGHRNAVYCAIFDRSGRHLITGTNDRLVKIWSSETGLCLRSCRGHEGDITDLAVSCGTTNFRNNCLKMANLRCSYGETIHPDNIQPDKSVSCPKLTQICISS